MCLRVEVDRVFAKAAQCEANPVPNSIGFKDKFLATLKMVKQKGESNRDTLRVKWFAVSSALDPDIT